MRAIFLAGGKGTRLRPYTTLIPKPLVPVGEYAIMEIMVRQLIHSGCDHITVSLTNQAHLVSAFFGDGSRWGIKIDYSVEEKPLSTIGPLKLIKDLPDNFLLMNGDILTDLSMRDLYDDHCKSGATATIATYERNVKVDFGVLETNEDKRIVGFVEKPIEHFRVSMGIYALSKKILDLVPDNTPYGFDKLMLNLIARKDNARSYPFTGYWLDIGRPDDYDQANDEFEKMRPRLLPDEAGK